MKTILITGGLGFIGSNFIQMVFNKYGKTIRIVNVDKDTLGRKDHKHFKHIPQIHNKELYLYREADICNLTKMQALIYFYRPQIIVNFAAETHVDQSIQTPQQYAQTNILGTTALLIAASKYYNYLLDDVQRKKFRFHHISTDEVFGDLALNCKDKFTQNTIYNPSSPYSATKAGSDHLVRAWGRTYGLPYSISNCSNNYGKYQDDTKLIPKVIKACMNQQQITIHGTGQYVRDWIHVQDHCEGILKILDDLQLTHNETYLFGGQCQKSNLQVIDLICEIMDKKNPRKNGKSYKELKIFVQNRAGQDLKYSIDCSKAKQQLGWIPQSKFEQKVELLINNGGNSE